MAGGARFLSVLFWVGDGGGGRAVVYQVCQRGEDADELVQGEDAILGGIRHHDSERESQAMRQHILTEGARVNIDLRLPQV